MRATLLINPPTPNQSILIDQFDLLWLFVVGRQRWVTPLDEGQIRSHRDARVLESNRVICEPLLDFFFHMLDLRYRGVLS